MQATICCKGKLISTHLPLVMGILNVTGDSFYDGGNYQTEAQYLKHTEEMLSEGADVIDVGLVSTRPGAKELEEEEELRRCEQVVTTLTRQFPETLFSLDTWRASVARLGVELGVSVINDISGGTFDPDMFETVAALQVPYILTHTPGKPEVMQQRTQYQDVVQEVYLFLSQRIRQLRSLNVKDIIVDLGFGFGKTLEQNYLLLKNMSAFLSLGCPILTALSRKSMLYKLTGNGPEEALPATVAAHTIALLQDSRLLRVHDVKAAKDCIQVWKAFAEIS